MHKQLWLEFIEQQELEALWEGFPETAQTEVTRQYARLMAKRLAAQVGKATLEKGVGDESSDA